MRCESEKWWKNKWIRGVGWIVAVFLCCFFSQVLAFMVPSEWTENNVKDSAYELREGGTYTLAPGYRNMQSDTFTDSWMLNIASYREDKPALEKAMGNFFYDFGDMYSSEGKSGPFASLFESTQGNDNLKSGSYSRYWHGYMFFLRVLLIFLNYSEIKMLNAFSLMPSLIYLFYLFVNKMENFHNNTLKFGAGWGLILWILVINPSVISICMSYSGVIYISVLASILLLCNEKLRMEKNLTILFFVTVGMLTSFIDLLSAPLLTLGIPLIFFVILTEAKTYRKAFIDVVLPSICWGTGYAGMWSAKWILGTIILKRNVLAEAMGAATARSGIVIQEEGGIEINGLSPIMVTLRILASKPFLIIFSVTLFIILLFSIYNVFQKRKFNFLSPRNMQFLIIAIYPIIWSQVLKNHTYVHSWFTYRIWSISVFAIALFLFWGVGNINNCLNGDS